MSFKEWLRSKNARGWFALAIMVAYVVMVVIVGFEMVTGVETLAQEALLK
jgi:purine-cytosine permease-like protein